MRPDAAQPIPESSDPPARRSHRRRPGPLSVCLVLGAALLFAQGAWRTPADPVEPLVLEETARLTSLDKAATLRVATFNIHGGVGNDGVCDLSRTAGSLDNLDVAALQEVRNPFGGRQGPQVCEVARQLGMGWMFIPAERRWWHSHYGNALLTRVPLVDSIRIPLPTSHRQRFRAALLANFRFQGQTVHLLAVHIDKDLERETHDQQLRTAFDLFLSLREPAILLGDLNDVASHPELDRLLQTPGVHNALAGVPRTGKHKFIIDWIITRGFQTLRGEWRDGPASDHPAAWAELQLVPKVAARPDNPTRPPRGISARAPSTPKSSGGVPWPRLGVAMSSKHAHPKAVGMAPGAAGLRAD